MLNRPQYQMQHFHKCTVTTSQHMGGFSATLAIPSPTPNFDDAVQLSVCSTKQTTEYTGSVFSLYLMFAHKSALKIQMLHQLRHQEQPNMQVKSFIINQIALEQMDMAKPEEHNTDITQFISRLANMLVRCNEMHNQFYVVHANNNELVFFYLIRLDPTIN